MLRSRCVRPQRSPHSLSEQSNRKTAPTRSHQQRSVMKYTWYSAGRVMGMFVQLFC